MPLGVLSLELGVSLVGLALYLASRLIWRRTTLPPGPLGWPLVGNLFDLRAQAPYKALGAMSSKYGPIISLQICGIQCFVLNSFKVTKDLLERRSTVTSNRPHFTIGGDLVGWGNFTACLQYGGTHRKHRKFFTRHVHANSGLAMFYATEEAEARRFFLNILRKPDDLFGHCRRTIASLIWKISHGYAVKDDADPLVELANRALRNLHIVLAPGRYLADFFPIFRYWPKWLFAGKFYKDAEEWRALLQEAVNTPYQLVLEQLSKGDAAPSLLSQLLQECHTAKDEEIAKWTTFGMYLGGADTTPYVLFAFFLAMTMYPDIFEKAQTEVAHAIGNNRLPTMEDREMLPYVNALCKELLRWNVVIPCPTHLSTDDIVYEGYLIPKGSWLLPNIWFILSDPATYPDPEKFSPERFLGEDNQPDPREACFGWGRRACLGARLVESILFIYVATALATLDISRCTENGVESMPKYDFEEGIFRRLKPFKCQIVPRSKKAEELLCEG